MDRNKVLELAGMAGFNWPEISTTTIEERLERFAALIEREVRGDAEPVAWGNMRDDGNTPALLSISQHPEDRENWSNPIPLYTHPTPAVVRQLVEAAADAKSDIHSARLCEVNSMSSRDEMRRLMDSACEKLCAALAAAEIGKQMGGSDD